LIKYHFKMGLMSLNSLIRADIDCRAMSSILIENGRVIEHIA
jgi:hypothetical protein